MQNDTNSINELVTKTAEENTKKEDTGNNQQQQGGGSGGADDAAQAALKLQEEQKAAADKLEAEKNQQQPDKLAELLKELNLDSIDTLKAKLNGKAPDKVLTKEEQDKVDAIYEADLIKFGVENGDMKLDDFHQLKTVKSKADAELVFEKYLDSWKEENPDEAEDIEDKARTDFEAEYKLNSKSEKAKERGVAKLARDAKDLRSPLESSFEKVKGKFDTQKELIQNLPTFNKEIEDTAGGLIPEKVEWFKGKDGEEDVAIEVELTPEEKKEISGKVSAKFKSPEMYLLFKEGKQTEIKEAMQEFAEKLSEKATKERANLKVTEKFAEIAEKAFKKGGESGAKVGAENSFAVNQGKNNSGVSDKTTTKAENQQTVLKQFGNKKLKQ